MTPNEGEGPSIRLGVIVSPAIDADVSEQLLADLALELEERYPGSQWELEPVHEWLVEPPAHLTEVLDATRARMLERDWDLAASVTEIPLRLSRRPLLSHSSPIHGVALVSLPAVGVLQRQLRLRVALANAVGALIGDDPREPGERRRPNHGRRARRRLTELATNLDERDDTSVLFLARVISGNVRLLFGMIAANHPWRLVVTLSRALIGALAAAAFALVTSDVWRIAAHADVTVLSLLTVVSISAAVATLIAAHGLWERARDRWAREQVALFNLATLVTVVLGIATLYAAVFAVCLLSASLMIDHSVISSALSRDADAWDYVRLAWFASSFATVAGALGATLETDEAVREAAYAYRPER